MTAQPRFLYARLLPLSRWNAPFPSVRGLAGIVSSLVCFRVSFPSRSCAGILGLSSEAGDHVHGLGSAPWNSGTGEPNRRDRILDSGEGIIDGDSMRVLSCLNREGGRKEVGAWCWEKRRERYRVGYREVRILIYLEYPVYTRQPRAQPSRFQRFVQAETVDLGRSKTADSWMSVSWGGEGSPFIPATIGDTE